MSNQIQWIDNDVIVTFITEVTFAEISAIADSIYQDQRFGKLNYQLWDFSRVEKHNITIAEASVIGGIDRSTSVWNNNVKVALVSSNLEFRLFILAYMKKLEDTTWKVRAFRNVPDAKKWCTE